jgi:hypothetical protein
MGSQSPPQRSDALYGPTIVGLFWDRQRAGRALGELRDTGFAAEQISVLLCLQEEEQQSGARTLERAEGGRFPAGAGHRPPWLSESSMIALPAGGTAAVAGPLARRSVAAGGLTSALIGAGVREEDAHIYGSALLHGGVLLVAQAYSDDQARGVYALFERWGAEGLRAYGLATGEPETELPAEPG